MERLFRAGFTVAFTYNTSRNDAEDLARSIDGTAIQADLTDPLSAVGIISKKLPDSFRQLDVLVNNASLYLPAKLAETELELSRKLMAIHFESPYLLCRQFAPSLRAARGHVVNMVDVMVEKTDAELSGVLCKQISALESDIMPGTRTVAGSNRQWNRPRRGRLAHGFSAGTARSISEARTVSPRGHTAGCGRSHLFSGDYGIVHHRADHPVGWRKIVELNEEPTSPVSDSLSR